MLHKHFGPDIIVQKIQKDIAESFFIDFSHLHIVSVSPSLLVPFP